VSRKKSGKTTGRMRGPSVTARPDSPYVSVFCSGTTARAHEKWRIASFFPEVHEEVIVWHDFGPNYYEPDSPIAIRVAGTISQWLVGDRWISRDDHDADVFSEPAFRVRWSLGCGVCGMRKVIAPPSTFYEKFNLMAQLGIKEVGLSHLVNSG